MKPPFRTVICPTDLSPVGNLAIPVAYRLADKGSVVHLLNVDEPANTGNPLYPDERPKGAPTPAALAAAKAADVKQMEALVPPDAKARGITTQFDVLAAGDVALAIEELAKKLKADVVVLASHGRWGIARLLKGESVALRLLHKKDLDVVVVHSDKP